MRLSACSLIVALAGAAGAARADVGAAVAVGGGVHAGAAMSSVDARADWASDGGGAAIGLGARLRATRDGVYAADWDQAADWIAIVRYVELRREAADGDRAEIVGGAMPEATLGAGALVGGVVPAALLDRRATGVRTRARIGRGSFEALVDDVARPAVVGARAAIARTDASRELAIEGAIDPAAPSTSGAHPFGALAVSAALTTGYREVTDRVEAGVTVQAAAGAPGAGAWLGATTAAELGDTRFALRGEVTLGTAHDLARPFGPLYLIERGLPAAGGAMAPAQLDLARAGQVGGLGGAVTLDVEAQGVRATATMRARPGLGGELDARLVAPAFRAVQAAALVAANPSRHLYVAGAEVRVRAGRRAFVAVEAARQYDPADAAAVWQATAWLGVATAP